MDRRAGASWQAVIKHCDLKFGRLRAAWPAELDGFLERMEGGFKLKKTATTFFCMTWRLLIVSSRVALSSKVVRRGAAVLQKQVLFPDVFQIYYSQPTSN